MAVNPIITDHIASIIYGHMTDGYYDVTRAWVADLNREGWTFETSGSMGSRIRHEDVVLSEGDLDLAYATAKRWLRGEWTYAELAS